MIATLSRRPRGETLAVAGLLGIVALIALYVAHKYGALAAGGVVVGLALVLLLLNYAPRSLSLFLGVGLLAESDPDWGIGFPAKIYNHAPSPFEGLEAIALLAVLLYLAAHGRRPRLSGLAVLQVLLVAGLLTGTLTALSTGLGQRFSYLSVFQSLSPLLVVPFMIVNVVRSPAALSRALHLLLGLTIVKALLGLFIVFSGLAPLQAGFGRLTYYAAPGNMLCSFYLVVVAAAAFSRVKLPRWVWLGAPLVFACLLLSYRRSFWLGTVLALLVVIGPASGYLGRRLLLPGALVVGVFVYLALATGVTGALQGGITSRVASINISSIQQNTQDRYRIDERKNVWAAIRQNPFTGIGIATPWSTRYALGFEYAGGHLYTHLAVLWWWMKMGVLGLLSYLALFGTAIITGLRVWRRHQDPLIRMFGLGTAMFTVGMALVEVTATEIGADERSSLVMAVFLGLLAAARNQTGLRSQSFSDDKLAR